MMRCSSCLYPNSKPDLYFDASGRCAACANFEARPTIDWTARKAELAAILETGRDGSGFDCIVPSSGGKDSHFQVRTLLDMGARPLVVTASTDYLTPIGRANIDNLAKYATTIEVTPRRDVRAKLCRLGLELVGDVCWPEHASIFSTPFRIAASLGIPLVFYGESPQREYGGPLGAEAAATMTRRWVGEYGGLLGLRPSDFIGKEGITAADMADYALPDDETMGKVTAYFLGQFMPWDSRRNARVAKKMGMRQELPSPANWFVAENLDNALTGLHDHGMYRKYGYGRACAQLSIDIRNGLISREAALFYLRERDGEFPGEYAGVGFSDVWSFLGMTPMQVRDALTRHTNWDLFVNDPGLARPMLKEWAAAEVAA